MHTITIQHDAGEVSDGHHTFNELYEHRHALFLALMDVHALTAWLSAKHEGGTAFDGWFIAGIELPSGMITYHLPDRLMGRAMRTGAKVLDNGLPWDGHTSEDVIRRLHKSLT